MLSIPLYTFNNNSRDELLSARSQRLSLLGMQRMSGGSGTHREAEAGHHHQAADGTAQVVEEPTKVDDATKTDQDQTLC